MRIRPAVVVLLTSLAARAAAPDYQAAFPSYRFRDEWLQLLQSADGGRP